jgi:hypothetical protein
MLWILLESKNKQMELVTLEVKDCSESENRIFLRKQRCFFFPRRVVRLPRAKGRRENGKNFVLQTLRDSIVQ